MKYIVRAAILFLALGLAVGTRHASPQEKTGGKEGAVCTLHSFPESQSELIVEAETGDADER